MYCILIISDLNNNSKETYDFFRHSVSLTLQQIIGHVDTLKSTYYQYEIDWLDWSGRYIWNSLDPSLLENILNKTTVTAPDQVVLVSNYITVADFYFYIMEQCKR